MSYRSSLFMTFDYCESIFVYIRFTRDTLNLANHNDVNNSFQQTLSVDQTLPLLRHLERTSPSRICRLETPSALTCEQLACLHIQEHEHNPSTPDLQDQNLVRLKWTNILKTPTWTQYIKGCVYWYSCKKQETVQALQIRDRQCKSSLNGMNESRLMGDLDFEKRRGDTREIWSWVLERLILAFNMQIWQHKLTRSLPCIAVVIFFLSTTAACSRAEWAINSALIFPSQWANKMEVSEASK